MVEDLIKSMHIENENYDTETNKVNIELYFPFNSPIFYGHFPDKPILAGAYQLMLVKYFAGKLLNSDLNINLIKKSKFLSLIGADDKFLINIETAPVDEKKTKYKVKSKIEFNNKTAMETTMLVISK